MNTASSRKFVLVDLENLMNGRATRAEVRNLWHSLTQSLEISTRDRIVVGTNRYTASKFATTIAGDSVTWVVGANAPDGADRALLAATNLHQVAKGYDELVILSGDHAFVELARGARRRGLYVRVATTERESGRTSLSRALAAAADESTSILFPRASTDYLAA